MRTLSEKRVFNLISSFYEIAGEPSVEVWTEAFTELSALVSSGPGSLSFYSADDKRFDFAATTLNQELLVQYNDYYQYVSPFRHRILQMNAGERFSRAAYCPDAEFLETEIYQHYFKKQDVFNYEYLVFYKEAGITGGISFSRPEKMKNFGSAEIRMLETIVPHLRRAFQIHVKLAEVQRDKQIMLDCFEKISQSVLVVDRTGKIVFLNESAERLMIGGDGLQLDRNSAIAASSAGDTKKLKACLQSVFEPNFGQHVNCGGALQISRPSGRRPLTVFVSPFVEKSFRPFSGTLAVLYISDPAVRVDSVEPVLSEIYGLTPAESRLAAILAQGASLSEACGLLRIKQNTIRTHLKRIFSKTETNRQSELVKLILNNSVNLRR